MKRVLFIALLFFAMFPVFAEESDALIKETYKYEKSWHTTFRE